MLHVTQVVVFDVNAPLSKRFSASVYTVLNRALQDFFMPQQIVAAAKRFVTIFTRIVYHVSTTKLIV